MNEFVDMHVHSKFSIDGMSTMEDYCLIAGKTGTRVICFTEHVDFNSAEKNLSIVKRTCAPTASGPQSCGRTP